MQTVIRGASQLKVTRSRMTPGSSAGTGDRWTSRPPVEAVQPPYHLFRRGIEAGLLPYAAAHHISVLAYGPLARGLLGGTITEATRSGDTRSVRGIFKEQQAPIVCELTPGVAVGEISCVVHDDDGPGFRRALERGVQQRHEGSVQALDVDKDRRRAGI